MAIEYDVTEEGVGAVWFLAWQLSQVVDDDIQDIIEHALDHSLDGLKIRDDTVAFRGGPSASASDHLKDWREGKN